MSHGKGPAAPTGLDALYPAPAAPRPPPSRPVGGGCISTKLPNSMGGARPGPAGRGSVRESRAGDRTRGTRSPSTRGQGTAPPRRTRKPSIRHRSNRASATVPRKSWRRTGVPPGRASNKRAAPTRLNTRPNQPAVEQMGIPRTRAPRDVCLEPIATSEAGQRAATGSEFGDRGGQVGAGHQRELAGGGEDAAPDRGASCPGGSGWIFLSPDDIRAGRARPVGGSQSTLARRRRHDHLEGQPPAPAGARPTAISGARQSGGLLVNAGYQPTDQGTRAVAPSPGSGAGASHHASTGTDVFLSHRRSHPTSLCFPGRLRAL